MPLAIPIAHTLGVVSVVFGYIPLSLGLPLIITLPLSIIVLFLIVRFVGQPVETEEV